MKQLNDEVSIHLDVSAVALFEDVNRISWEREFMAGESIPDRFEYEISNTLENFLQAGSALDGYIQERDRDSKEDWRISREWLRKQILSIMRSKGPKISKEELDSLILLAAESRSTGRCEFLYCEIQKLVEFVEYSPVVRDQVTAYICDETLQLLKQLKKKLEKDCKEKGIDFCVSKTFREKIKRLLGIASPA